MKRRNKDRPEDAVQRAVFAELRIRGVPGVVAFHIPNAAKRSAKSTASLKGLGMLPGAPDVVLIKDGHCFLLEIKWLTGRLSDDQIAVHERLRTAGATVGVTFGLKATLEWLESHGLLRPEVRVIIEPATEKRKEAA